MNINTKRLKRIAGMCLTELLALFALLALITWLIILAARHGWEALRRVLEIRRERIQREIDGEKDDEERGSPREQHAWYHHRGGWNI
jgi:hypothetical protein